eukprot:11196059-Lingulodinium_polyedra.AAC.1
MPGRSVPCSRHPLAIEPISGQIKAMAILRPLNLAQGGKGHAQAVLRPCSGRAQAVFRLCSGPAQ